MNIYWNQKDIPALKRLSVQEREAAKKEVIGKVWRHWQVWLPVAIQVSAYIAFLILAPQFPYRFLVVLIAVVVTAKLAAFAIQSLPSALPEPK